MSRMYVPGLVYDEPATHDAWFKYIIFGIPLLLVVIGLFLIKVDIEGTFFMLGDAAFVGLLFYFIMPRRYQIYEDRIKIVLGRPFSITVNFSTIGELRTASGTKAMAYHGIRFATNTRSVVEIKRSRGTDIVISPGNRDVFLEQYRLARQSYDKIHKSASSNFTS